MGMKQLIYFLMALLGFGLTSCEDGEKDHYGVVEYGSPHVNFSLKARVVDQVGTPIQGIEVRLKGNHRFDDKSGFSDYMGNIDAYGSVWPGSQYEVVFVDDDGEANGGQFESVELDITDKVRQTEKGDNRWYEGSYIAELGDVTMTLVADEGDEESAENRPEE